MRISLDEKDFEPVLLDGDISFLSGKSDRQVLGTGISERAELLMRKMPVAIASILNSIEPEGFAVTEFVLDVELSGKPFGIGISGKGSVRFVRKRQ